MTYLDCGNVGVLRGILVVVKTVLCRLALSQIDTKLYKKEHNRLKGGDGAVTCALRGDMFVQDRQSSLLLSDSDELLGSLYCRDVLA